MGEGEPETDKGYKSQFSKRQTSSIPQNDNSNMIEESVVL